MTEYLKDYRWEERQSVFFPLLFFVVVVVVVTLLFSSTRWSSDSTAPRDTLPSKSREMNAFTPGSIHAGRQEGVSRV